MIKSYFCFLKINLLARQESYNNFQHESMFLYSFQRSLVLLSSFDNLVFSRILWWLKWWFKRHKISIMTELKMTKEKYASYLSNRINIVNVMPCILAKHFHENIRSNVYRNWYWGKSCLFQLLQYLKLKS